MSNQQQAPVMQGTKQGQIPSFNADNRLHLHSHCKDTKNLLTPAQQKVLNLLMYDGIYSVADISTRLMMYDPRSAIRHIRHSGVEVSDTWVKGGFGGEIQTVFYKFK